MRADQLSIQQYRDGLIAGSAVILGRAITLIESQLDSDQQQAEELLQSILPLTGKSTRIAISGVPGVGKSTFIESFGKYLTSQHHKVAVLAVDPTSSKTHGSILGDKTRMEELSKDPNAFVRPTATSGHLGGVAGKTREAILLCEAAGYNIIIIETVGVGQSEIAVRSMVDFVLLLMLAGAGDELQGIKKGIIEIADGIAINKADGDNITHAKRAQAELSHALHLVSSSTKVVTCSALVKTGLDEIWKMVTSFKEKSDWQERRKEQQEEWLRESLNELFLREAKKINHKFSDLPGFPPAVARQLFKELIK
ncbi:MAG: methylmalonyl Co-A mutase-associated GTPase MeaB [Bacteroidota bacterium]